MCGNPWHAKRRLISLLNDSLHDECSFFVVCGTNQNGHIMEESVCFMPEPNGNFALDESAISDLPPFSNACAISARD